MTKNAYIGALVDGIITDIHPYGLHVRIKNTDLRYRNMPLFFNLDHVKLSCGVFFNSVVASLFVSVEFFTSAIYHGPRLTISNVCSVLESK